MLLHDTSRLAEFKPNSKYLVAVDSDGCVFNNMGIKQEECFCPLMIGYFGLQPVARAARQCKIFADLYSKTRGSNRHITIARILEELLPSHPIVKERAFKVPDFSHYCAWVKDSNSLLSNRGLREAATKPKSLMFNILASFCIFARVRILSCFFAFYCSILSVKQYKTVMANYGG